MIIGGSGMQRYTENIMKILFSTVIVQLFLIALACEGDTLSGSVFASLEHSAMSGVLILGGWLSLEYVFGIYT